MHPPLHAANLFLQTINVNSNELILFSEIRNFLSSKECEYIKKLAKKNKLVDSITHLDEGLIEKKKGVTGTV